MALIDHISYAAAVDGWQEMYEDTARQLHDDVALYPPDSLRLNLVPGPALHELPRLNGRHIEELQRGLRGMREQEASV